MTDLKVKLDGVALKIKQLMKCLSDSARKKSLLLEKVKAITLLVVLEEQWQESLKLEILNEKILQEEMNFFWTLKV